MCIRDRYGTCGFGPVFDLMPKEFKESRIIGFSQDAYNGRKTETDFKKTCNPQKGISCGMACGECYEVFGPKGWNTFIQADICDVPVVGIECAGDVVQIDINNVGSGQVSNKETWRSIGDNLGYEVGAYRRVPCSTSGNIGLYLPEPGSNKWSVAATLYNHRIGIAKFEIRGAGQGVRQNNTWIELPRDWTNKFLWRGVENYPNQKGDIYNGGTGFNLRITSIYGEVLEPSKVITIPSSNPDQVRFDLGVQFKVVTDTKNTDASKCPVKMVRYIYKDRVVNRKRTGDNKNFEECQRGSWGCRTYFEGGFMTEWWLVHIGDIQNVDLSSKEECQENSCIRIPKAGPGAVFIIGYSSGFPTKTFSRIRFSAKLHSSASASQYANARVTFDDCGSSASVGAITKDWKEFSVPFASLNCPTRIRNLKFILGNAEQLLIDNIYLE
eukprot:TRINITY_DN4664_c0_g2_i1.p1 TRINITY_DN4664_c0_g2~~TRINITY_DN4664_c0_g2_i1.p1  ORF type:complete len:440 (+),score=114.43 TRINITY_DN4664_c0_g2_i1:65-1384(+)